MSRLRAAWASGDTRRSDPPSFAAHSDARTHVTTPVPIQVRRRRDASWRMPPLHCGHHDDLDCLAAEVPTIVGPERFGLTTAEARRHANDLVSDWGFSVDEVVQVLGIEPRLPVAC
jgi:hypothetical protein